MQYSAVALTAALAALASTPACRPSPPAGPGLLEISLTGQADTISIVGSNVSRTAVLEELRARHGVEVRAEAPDERISPRIVNVPLVVGIERLLPPGTRYALRIAERDRQIGILPRTGEKQGARDVRPDTLPTKDKTGPLPRSPDARLKQPPDRSYLPQEAGGPGRKPPADSVVRVPEGRGPKLERSVPAQDSSLRLSFRITAPDSIRLVDARLVAGAAPLARNVQGPLLFAFRVAGRIVHFGALLDPLEQHSYLEDGTHDVGRANEGSFGIWVPPEAMAPMGTGPVTVEFYDARAVTLPLVLDEKSFSRAAEQARKLARLEWPSLREVLNGGRAQ